MDRPCGNIWIRSRFPARAPASHMYFNNDGSRHRVELTAASCIDNALVGRNGFRCAPRAGEDIAQPCVPDPPKIARQSPPAHRLSLTGVLYGVGLCESAGRRQVGRNETLRLQMLRPLCAGGGGPPWS